MEFPLEIFYTIYRWCSPQTVYPLACASFELSQIAPNCFKHEKALFEHKQAFKETLKLIDTDYLIDPEPNVSVRYEGETDRTIGYRLRVENQIIYRGNDLTEELAIVSSHGPRLTVNWKPARDQSEGVCFEFYNMRIYAVKFEDASPVDPTDDEFHDTRTSIRYNDHIVLYSYTS